MKTYLKLFVLAMLCFCVGTAFASGYTSASGIAGVAATVTGNLANIAKLITAGSYVAGMGFGVAAVAKFKAHKDNPQQVAISVPIALLFIAAGLIFIPGVFRSAGGTLFGASGMIAGTSGITQFGK